MAAVVNLQAQVESVLGALVKAATVELTKLFESRYRASVLDVDAVAVAGRAEDGKQNATLDSSSTGDTTRSIGVQVDDDINPPLELSGPPLLSDGDCEREGVEGPLIPPEILLDEDKSPVDPEGSPLREQQEVAETTDMGAETTDMMTDVVAETTDMGAKTTDTGAETIDVGAETTDMGAEATDMGAETTDTGAETTDTEAETTDMGAETTDTMTDLVAETTELSGLEVYSPADGDPQTEVVLHVSAEAWSEALRHGDTQRSPAKPKPLIIQPDTRDIVSGQTVKFVCPLIFKPESPAPKPDGSVKPEPTQVSVSTARGTAYSPSPSDGAVTPAQVRVWERIHTPKETKNNLHMKLKLTSPDQKLTRPCAVQLVDVIKGAVAKGHDAKHKTGWPLPKDLRRHQGVHTGHRLCCFTACENGVWRLQKVVTHSRDGYPCGICGKTFKRRKILRRHERFHTGEKPYSCTTCRKSFALRKSLRRHARFHTGQRPHTCTHCGKSFRLRDNLKAHLRFHTGEKPYSCPTCGKMFRIMKNLEKHRLSECEVFVPSFRTIAGLQQRNNGGP